jgi:formylmethanofuran dehydrogenase subunit E
MKKLPDFAPVFSTVNCSICRENVMETRARIKNGKPVCIECAKEEPYLLDGRGITTKGI